MTNNIWCIDPHDLMR